MDLGLVGKRVLITGGASGLGAALALTLGSEGAEICINYRSRHDEAQALLNQIRGIGAKAEAVQADLVNMWQTRQLFDQAVKLLGGLDILVNNAAIWATCTVGEISEEIWDTTFQINLKSPMVLSQLFINHCVANGHTGRILNVTSQAGFLGSSTGHIPYAVSKGGLITLTRSLAREMGNNGVTVNALAIGMMESPMVAPALDVRREYYEAKIPIGRVASAKRLRMLQHSWCQNGRPI